MTRRKLGNLPGEIIAVDTTSLDALFARDDAPNDPFRFPAIVILRRIGTNAVMVDVFVDDDDEGWQRADSYTNYLSTRARR